MPLTLTENVANSRKAYLNEIQYFVGAYNDMGEPSKDAQDAQSKSRRESAFELLYMIAFRAGLYLTYRPRATHKKAGRWDTLAKLVEQIGTEAAKWGGKTMVGNYSTIGQVPSQRNYWLEILDPQKRPGQFLSQNWNSWNSQGQSWLIERKSFFEWLDGATGLDYTNIKGTVPNVAYPADATLDQDAHIWENDGTLQDITTAATTQSMRTPDMGQGWGIFVCTGDGTMYLKSGIAGTFHHSSFVGGRIVVAAGEIAVENGVIGGITAQSGHYHTTPVDMHTFLTYVPHRHNDAVIMPDVNDRTRWHTISAFRSQGTSAPKVPYIEDLKRPVPLFSQSYKFNEIAGALERKVPLEPTAPY